MAKGKCQTSSGPSANGILARTQLLRSAPGSLRDDSPPSHFTGDGKPRLRAEEPPMQGQRLRPAPALFAPSRRLTGKRLKRPFAYPGFAESLQSILQRKRQCSHSCPSGRQSIMQKEEAPTCQDPWSHTWHGDFCSSPPAHLQGGRGPRTSALTAPGGAIPAPHFVIQRNSLGGKFGGSIASWQLGALESTALRVPLWRKWPA